MKINPELKQKIIEFVTEGEDHPEIEEVEEGDWTEQGKYSYCETIVKVGEDYYGVSQSRSGSYFTDYHYDDPEVYRVKRKVEIKEVVTWEAM